MDAFLAYGDSLRMLRCARRSDELDLVPCDAYVRAASGRVDLPLLTEALAGMVPTPTPGRPVALRCSDDASRSQSALVRSVPNLSSLPEGSYLEVATKEGGPLVARDDVTVHVFVEAPALALVGAARLLQRAIRSGQLSRDAALVRLTALAMELCGTYARDSEHPLTGEVAHNLESIGHLDAVRPWLADARSLHGLPLARRAASWANDGSNSTMETLWYLVFCLPPRFGGLHLPRPLQNVSLEWPESVRELACHERMRPDFHWPGYRTVCEHLGGDHEGFDAVVEDSGRARDYELCDISYLPLTKQDLRDEPAARALLAQLVRVIEPHETISFRRRMRRALSDPDVIAARRVLLAQLLPPRAQWSSLAE